MLGESTVHILYILASVHLHVNWHYHHSVMQYRTLHYFLMVCFTFNGIMALHDEMYICIFLEGILVNVKQFLNF